ncbi:MAG: anaerobic ribonucleoside-triphosphate reductase activating protein [Bacteroidales bacterium]
MNYHNITKCDMLNGEGLRVVLWLSHCIHNCPGCHNQQTHDANSGICFDESALGELFTELQKDYIAGITFSGGDPLSPLNRKPVLELCDQIRREYPTKNIWLYTGFLWEDICGLPGIAQVDVVVDGPFVLAQKDNSLPYRGSANQRIIDVKATFSEGRVVEKALGLL